MSSPERSMSRRNGPVAHGWFRDAEWQAATAGVVAWPGDPPQCWRKGLLAALVSRDEITPGDERWHISVQHRDRVPAWNELAAAGHELRPGVVFAIGVPPRSWWINVHEHVLHLWELRDAAFVEQWKLERQGHTPS